ncbi:UvrD-helicase domain-containing protein [Olleya namhaensis]|uniref:DNA 3'-5' helicase n=1 Tax=Olleya namhaensis TaxID=1144750 RepID=A0A1I3JB11_9FLAO|nr:UvrD-helicase domain-containing protein [Olleya namhaensis]SFI57413.1 ATP-dependent exoDNAse (exonuclease V) beta subunit (contains helicase and exonuclease domains) [Olleya namhaensis]
MSKTTPFKVYDASAGSGKTFALVKEYLKLLFTATYNDGFKQILAITFTNKAVGEMKTRILDTLKQFSDPEISADTNGMFKAITEELALQPKDVHQKAIVLLNTIMHNYAAFDISTIDGFNHKLIRTFAHDLKIPINFEVELDTPSLLSQAVDSLIAKAGTDKKLTKVLIDFALEKADDDKSWDVSRDFNTIAKLLINDNDLPHLESIKHKTLEDFSGLKSQLIKQIANQEVLIAELANNLLSVFEANGLDQKSFSRGTLFNHFVKISNLEFYKIYDNQLANNIAEGKLYTKTLDSAKAQAIDQLLPQIETVYHKIKTTVLDVKFLRAVYKNVTPLSVLNAINKELTLIKEDENKLLISEFNTLISKEIKNQPTPFIYERLGEKFRHYFIDEFQDTSQMQWENLIPLIENTLTGQNLKGEQGTAMLVGDAKQAIYRWRGGKAEQFIGLTKEDNPFPVEKEVVRLEYNYRSYKNVIEFNNQFFDYLSQTSFSSPDYSDLYNKAKQKPVIKHEGYVNLNFLDIQSEDDINQLYPETVFETINKCLENNYNLKDICILVRKKKEGVAIAEYLSDKGVRITSSETMLINNSEDVRLVVNIFRLLVNPNNLEVKIKVLDYIASLNAIEDKHQFFKTHLNLPLQAFFESFKLFDIDCDPTQLVQLSLYDLAESIVRGFNLTKKSNAYIQYFLDIILEFSQKKISDIPGFLDYYDTKKDSLNIVSPSNQNAIQIMTIHKSKGLEFPVVIFPYAQLEIYREMEPKEWFPLDQSQFNGFSKTLINFNKDFEDFGDIGESIYLKHRSEQELDNMNLLYVALTRPIEQLYIISKKENQTKTGVKFDSYSGLLMNYLMQQGLWNDSQLEYSFGQQNREVVPEEKPETTQETEQFISVAKQDHDIKIITKSGYLWDTEQQNAIEKGNLIHDIMAEINTEKEVPAVIKDYINSGIINKEQALLLKDTINTIINHPELKDYYSTEYTIYNERDIISKSGTIIRPDRLAIKDNTATIIDYKTGLPDPKYQQQLETYSDILKEMNFTVDKKILIYVNDAIKIVTY